MTMRDGVTLWCLVLAVMLAFGHWWVVAAMVAAPVLLMAGLGALVVAALAVNDDRDPDYLYGRK